MRLWLGVVILLYGLLLALNTTAPAIAELAGEKVTVHLRGEPAECSPMMGRPPFGGVYGSCPAQWQGSSEGVLFGPKIAAEARTHQGPMDAYQYPFLSGYANIPPGDTDKVAGLIALLIIALGILIAVTERRQRTQQLAERELAEVARPDSLDL